MKKAAVLLLATMVTIVLSCGKQGTAEKEPNNSFAESQEISLKGKSAEVTGYLSDEKDTDYYHINIPEFSIGAVTLSGVKGINHAITLWRGAQSPELFKIIDDNRKSSSEEMVNFSFSPGRWYIAVSHGDRDKKKGNTENSYTLSITLRPPGAEEKEPNDSSARATDITGMHEITGYYSPSINRMNEEGNRSYAEEDWYRMEVHNSSSVADIELSAVDGVNPVLSVLDEKGEILYEIDRNNAGHGETIKGLALSRRGTYYILIYPRSFHLPVPSPYFLTVSFSQQEKGREYEPNDTIEKAASLDDGTIDGHIQRDDDVDVYRYEVPNRGLYRLTLDGKDACCNPKITILSSDGTTITTIDNGIRGESDVHPNLYLQQGTIYLQVSSEGSTLTDPFPYTLSISPLPEAEGTHEREPNDTRDLAMAMKQGPLIGYTSAPDDNDYYSFTFPNRSMRTLRVTPPKEGALRVSITDPFGYIIKTLETKGEPLDIREMFDSKGYILIETDKPDYDNSYRLEFTGGNE